MNFLALGLIVLASLTRILPHPANVTAVTAVALFSGWVFKGKSWGPALAIIGLITTDLYLGIYPGIVWVYGAFILVALIGSLVGKNNNKFTPYFLASITSTLVFYALSNFGVWLEVGIYPRTAAGLVECYVAAWPFLRNAFAGDTFFALSFYGLWKVALPLLKTSPNR